MLAHFRRDDALVLSAAVLLAVAIPLGVVSCDKVPLLAPTGTVLTLLATSDTAELNSSVDIIATAIENGQASSGTGTGAGTTRRRGPAPERRCRTARSLPLRRRSGELSRPKRERTTARYREADHRGPERHGDGHRVLGRRVDEHPDQRRQRRGRSRALDASPQTLGPSGGTSTVYARVENVRAPASRVSPVTFTTDAGSLSPTTATTNSDGVGDDTR